MKKKLLLTLLILVALSGIVWGATTHSKKPAPRNTNVVEQAKVLVSVVIDTGDGQQLTYPVKDPADATAFGVLQAATKANNVALDFDPPGQYGVFVKAISGKVGSKDQFWIYSVNGTEGTVAADKTTVNNGDTVIWKFTRSSAN